MFACRCLAPQGVEPLVGRLPAHILPTEVDVLTADQVADLNGVSADPPDPAMLQVQTKGSVIKLLPAEVLGHQIGVLNGAEHGTPRRLLTLVPLLLLVEHPQECRPWQLA